MTNPKDAGDRWQTSYNVGMNITFAVAEEVALRPVTAESILGHAQKAEPAPKARFTLSFDGEKAIQLTGAEWTVFPAFGRLEEAERFLKDAEIAHRIVRKLKDDDCMRFSKGYGVWSVGIAADIELSEAEYEFLRRRS